MPITNRIRMMAAAFLTLVGTAYGQQSFNFSYSGGLQTFLVPKNVYSVAVDISGASGGSSLYSKGGNGGRVQCVLSVTPGESLSVYIGGAGKKSNGVAPGGFNGGSPDTEDIAGGGGASDIRVGGTALSNRIVIAGGGGGASFRFRKKDAEKGGGGGGLTGENGYYDGGNKTKYSGGGATQIKSGMGADGDYYVGQPGNKDKGGAGAWYYCGGGGGGGYYGGGGGSMGGGGGGSSHTDSIVVSGVHHTQGYNTNPNGQLVITLSQSTPGTRVKDKHSLVDTTL